MFEKNSIHKERSTSTLSQKIGLSIYGGNFTKDINEEKIVTETWINENSDDRVEKKFPLNNKILIEKIYEEEAVPGYDKIKSMKTTPSHFGSFILSHCKKILNIEKKQGGFYNNRFAMYIQKKIWGTVS